MIVALLINKVMKTSPRKPRKFMIGLMSFALIGSIIAPLVNAYLENAGSAQWASFLTILPERFKQPTQSFSPMVKENYDSCVAVYRGLDAGWLEADDKCDYLKRQ